MIRNVTRSLSIFVYDDPAGSEGDDWGTVQFRNPPRGDVCIPSFERRAESSTYTQAYARKNGLDGKVSYVFIRYP